MNFNKLRRDIEEMEDLPTKRMMIADARAAVSRFMDDLEADLTRLKAQLEAMLRSEISRPAHTALRRAFIILAVVLVLGDVALQLVVNHIAFASMSISLVVLASISIAIALASLTHAGAYAGTFDWRRPMRSVRLCRNFAAAFGLIAVAALTVLFLSRVATPVWVPLLSHLVPPALWIASEVVPITAGFVWAAASVLSQPPKLRREVRKLQLTLQEAKRFKDWLDEEENAHPDTEVTSSPGGKKEPMIVSSAILGVILIFALFPWPAKASAFPSKAPNGPALSYATLRASQTWVDGMPRAQLRHSEVTLPSICQLYLDRSSSVDPIYRQQAVALFIRSLPGFVTAFNCDAVTAGNFFAAGEFTQRQMLSVPSPLPKNDCQKAEPVIRDKTMATFSSVLSGFNQFYRDRARQECRTSLINAERSYATAMRHLQKQVAGFFAGPDPKGNCTDIRGLLRAAMAMRGPVVVFTDAAESCFSSPAKFPLHSGPVIFVLVPSTGAINKAGPGTIRRAEGWRQSLPNLQFLPYTAISAEAWRQLASQKR